MEVIPFRTSKLFDHNYNIPEGCKLTINQGGTSSGKTYSILQVLFIIALVDPGSIITVVGQDIPNLKKGPIRDSKAIAGSSDYIQAQLAEPYKEQERVYKLRCGSIIEFNSYDNAQDAKSGKRDYLFINEINGIKEEVFEELYDRTKKHTWVDFNPTAFFWLLTDKYLKAADSRLILSTYKHNPFLDKEIIEKIERYKTSNPYKWTVYGLGKLDVLEGGIIKHEWLPRITWEQFKERTRSSAAVWHFKLDTAYTSKTSNDPTGYLACAFVGNCIYIRRAAAVRLELPELCEYIERQTKADGYTARSTIQVEAKASGLSVIQALKRSTKLNIKPFKFPKVEGQRMDDKDKVTRVHAITEILSSQRVYLIQDRWNNDFINECVEFPNSAHDDLVDCLVMQVLDSFFNIASDEFAPS